LEEKTDCFPLFNSHWEVIEYDVDSDYVDMLLSKLKTCLCDFPDPSLKYEYIYLFEIHGINIDNSFLTKYCDQVLVPVISKYPI
jgi:hypothetical protein